MDPVQSILCRDEIWARESARDEHVKACALRLERRDAGAQPFWYYVGSPNVLCGWVRDHVGYHVGPTWPSQQLYLSSARQSAAKTANFLKEMELPVLLVPAAGGRSDKKTASL
jgi:hypothetical protein